jgi:DNA-binding NarL/FixJ family response regulator
MNRITVLLVDDHSVFLEGLRTLLEAERDLHVVGMAGNGKEAVEFFASLNPDVVVMDIAMPVLNGVEATRQILKAHPGARVLILSAFSNPSCKEQVRELGVMGYLSKENSSRIIAQAIREVHQGHFVVDPSVIVESPVDIQTLAALVSGYGAQPVVLTLRETDVLQLIADGFLNKEIADTLKIGVKTAEKHRLSIRRKLCIRTTAGLTRYAIALGIAEHRE